MSVTIETSLQTFYDKVASSLDGISTTVSNLTSKLDELNTQCKATCTSISSAYNGTGLSTAMNSFASIDAACEGIKASIEAGPEAAISMAKDLVSKIEELISLKEEIDALDEKLSGLGSERSIPDDGEDHSADRAHNSKIRQVKSEIETKTSDFNTKQEAAKSALAALKALNPELDISVKTTEITSLDGIDLSSLEPGTYKTYTYTGSNGRTIKYSIYIPANAETTSGLGVHLYMGGSGEVNNMNAGGLAKLLTEGQQSTGIVIVLEADYSNAYVEGNYLDAAKELTDKVVQIYNCDESKISISGHSLGGIGCLAFAERYPDYFSVCAPVSGYNNSRGKNSSSTQEAYEKLSTVNIVAVTGKSDTNSYNSMSGLYSKLKSSGNMQFITVSGGHRIQFKMYGEQVEVNGKTYANWLEFCLSQTNSKVTTTTKDTDTKKA